jgi:hypothetical protein
MSKPEIYVNSKSSDLLKKLGFNEWCDSAYCTAYMHNGEEIGEDEEWELKCEGRGKEIKHVRYGTVYSHWYRNDENLPGCAARPTLSEARKWIREKLGVDITVAICKHDFGKGNEKAYFYECCRVTEDGLDEFYKNNYFHTYEDAEQAAVQFCLTTIMKDKKNETI